MFPSSLPKRNEGSGRWLVKILTGIFIIVFLGIHYVVNHLVATGGLLTYADVVQYYQNPIIPIMEIAFLTVVICHSFLGLRSILLDLHPSPKILKIANITLIAVGLVAILYGTWLALTIASRG